MMSVKVFSPATVANVACGFDVMGFCLETPGDEVLVSFNDLQKHRIFNKSMVQLPLEPEKNVTTIALKAMLQALESSQGFDITFLQKLPVGSGIGSSAASCAAGVFGANELLGNPFTRNELIAFAMHGEVAASGSMHADNIAPALLGGFTLVRSYSPLDVIALPCPDELFVVILFPLIELKTKDMRAILPRDIPLKTAIKQWGNVGGLVAGLYANDYSLIARSLVDHVAEPIRSVLIPGFAKVKEAAISNGALGFSISGSGPSMFALCQGKKTAEGVLEAMIQTGNNLGVEFRHYLSAISAKGCRLI